MAEVQKTQRAKAVFRELQKFNLFAPNPAAGQRQSRLAWGAREDNPRITVFTNTQTEKPADGIIAAGFNPETFFIFLKDFKKLVLESPAGTKRKIDCFQAVYGDDNKPTNEKVLLAELYYGKDDQGINWISLISGNKPKVKFEFKVSEYHKFYETSGQELPPSRLSDLQTLATIDALERIYIPLVGQFRLNTPAVQNNVTKAAETASTTSAQQTKFDDIDF